MKYLIIGCNNDLDTIVSVYMYYKFILNAGFEVQCYINGKISDEIKNIFDKLNIRVDFIDKINSNNNIVILNNDKFKLPLNIIKDKVTEIISLKDMNFTEYIDANVKIEEVSIVSTVILERYREYNINLTSDIVSLLLELYSNCSMKLSDRDNISKEYVMLFCKEV